MPKRWRKGFTLIEIMISVAITSIVGMALLTMNNNTLHLFTKIQNSSDITEQLSLIGSHGDVKYNRTDKTLYDILNKTYQIDNDEARQYLENIKYAYNEKIVDTITFGEDGSLEDENEQEESSNREELGEQAPLIQFELVQISIKNKQKKGYILQVRPI